MRWVLLSADLWLSVLGMLGSAGIASVHSFCGSLVGADVGGVGYVLPVLTALLMQYLTVLAYLHRPKFILPPAQDEPVKACEDDDCCQGPTEEP